MLEVACLFGSFCLREVFRDNWLIAYSLQFGLALWGERISNFFAKQRISK
jgi:hypothetical protein